MAIQALYPDTRPTLDLNFARAKRLDPRITFSRLSTGTYIGSDGLLKTAIANVARFDHDPITGESLGLLVEAAGTNLVLHNRDLTQAQWTKTNMTVARDQIGPDGIGNSASSIIADADRATVLQAITSASSARLTSAYVKRISGTGPIEMTQNGGLNWTAVPITASWTRVSIPSVTIENPTVGFRIGAIGDAIAVDYVQCENNSFSTSAIATTSATVTRAADVASMTGANFSSWYNVSQGTTFFATLLQTPVNSFSHGFLSEEASNQFRCGINGNSWFAWRTGQNIGPGSPIISGLNKGAFCYDRITSTQSRCFNATTPTDATYSIPLSPTSVPIVHAPGSVRIARLTYYPVRLPNAQLQALTAV
jgi:hypothetical protein